MFYLMFIKFVSICICVKPVLGLFLFFDKDGLKRGERRR